MAERKQTQKQISEQYAGAADYPSRPHYLRRLRLWLFVGAAVVSILGLFAFTYIAGQEPYSPGPISRNHARLASDCAACHRDAQPDRFMLKLERLMVGGSLAYYPKPATVLTRPPGTLMDAACLRCHVTAGLHLPQAASLALRPVLSELVLVHATDCATCHHEHAGSDRLALPSQQSCIACHNSPADLRRTRRSVKLPAVSVPASGENRDLGDGVLRFIAPASPGPLKPFPSYARGHPPFAYEQAAARDPGDLKFNHERHLRADIPKINNRRIDCADCHQAGAGGAFMQPVKYERHCAQCHTLQFTPSLPKLLIPHGDPEKVRYFLAGREETLDLAVRAEGTSDPREIKQRVQNELQALSRRGLATLAELEQRVFFEGDPPDRKGDRLMRAGNAKFLTECAKCHTVAPGDANHAPKVQPSNVAERWIEHGPFTHLPHQQMSCVDCHGAAAKSTKTSDILLPQQKLCAECHRPPATAGPSAPIAAGDPHALANSQRANGGIKWDCTNCHGFHAPPNAQGILEAALAPATPRPR